MRGAQRVLRTAFTARTGEQVSTLSLRQLLLGALALGLVVTGWYLLAPTSLGGSDTYAIVSGPSMWPRLVTGDLVVLRRSSEYRVGEIAAYKTPQVMAPIVHQIIGRSGGRYTFKGVNNGFVDPSRPTKQEIIGRVWIDLGRTGPLLQALKQPFVGGVVLFSAGAYALWPRRRLRRRRLTRMLDDEK